MNKELIRIINTEFYVYPGVIIESLKNYLYDISGRKVYYNNVCLGDNDTTLFRVDDDYYGHTMDTYEKITDDPKIVEIYKAIKLLEKNL